MFFVDQDTTAILANDHFLTGTDFDQTLGRNNVHTTAARVGLIDTNDSQVVAVALTDAVISGNTSNNTNKNTDQGGGGVYAGVRTLTLTNATISDNTAKSHGGGILFEINDNAVRDVMAMTVGGCTLDGNRSEGNGGGIYTRAKNVEIRALTEGEGEDAVKTPTTISNCTAAYSGGGIYQNRDPEGASVTVRDSVISGCASNDTSTDNNPPRGGGGIFANARAVSVIGSEIRNNTAVRNGGGNRCR